MPTRKVFIAAAAAAAASAGGFSQSSIAAADPKPGPSPKPTPSPPTKPSTLARELAQSLQHDLHQAHLSDAMTVKIAQDIQDNFTIAATFRKIKNENLPPPDFIFAASSEDRP